jgi:hypothetical protein
VNDILEKLTKLAIPIIFLVLAINITIAVFENPRPPPNPPPPGWSSIRIYYLHGDYDYFFRLRIIPQTIPF